MCDAGADPSDRASSSIAPTHLVQPEDGDLAQLRDRLRPLGSLVVAQPAFQVREDLRAVAARGAEEEPDRTAARRPGCPPSGGR